MAEQTEFWMYALYAIAYATSLAAFVMTNMMWLRTWIIVSSTCYAIYYYGFPAEPLWLDVITEAILVLLNVAMLVFIASTALRVRLADTDQFLYDSEFPQLSRNDFHKLLRIGEWCNISPGSVLSTHDEPMEHLYYLLKGEIHADLPGVGLVQRGEGTVVGEISFRTGANASATATASVPCLAMRWRQADLRALCRKNAEIRGAVGDFVSSHLAQKLAQPAV